MQRKPEGRAIIIENGNGHQCFDLGQIDVAVPSAGDFELRIERGPEHGLKRRNLLWAPFRMTAHDFRGLAQQAANPAGMQLVLIRTAGEAFEVRPAVESLNGPAAVGLLAGQAPGQRVRIGIYGAPLGCPDIVNVQRIDVFDRLRCRACSALDLAKCGAPGGSSGGYLRLHEVQILRRMKSPGMDKKFLSESCPGAQTHQQCQACPQQAHDKDDAHAWAAFPPGSGPALQVRGYAPDVEAAVAGVGVDFR